MDDERICYICFSGNDTITSHHEEGDQLIQQGCSCKNRFVHKRCLEDYISAARLYNPNDPYPVCRICDRSMNNVHVARHITWNALLTTLWSWYNSIHWPVAPYSMYIGLTVCALWINIGIWLCLLGSLSWGMIFLWIFIPLCKWPLYTMTMAFGTTKQLYWPLSTFVGLAWPDFFLLFQDIDDEQSPQAQESLIVGYLRRNGNALVDYILRIHDDDTHDDDDDDDDNIDNEYHIPVRYKKVITIVLNELVEPSDTQGMLFESLVTDVGYVAFVRDSIILMALVHTHEQQYQRPISLRWIVGPMLRLGIVSVYFTWMYHHLATFLLSSFPVVQHHDWIPCVVASFLVMDLRIGIWMSFPWLRTANNAIENEQLRDPLYGSFGNAVSHGMCLGLSVALLLVWFFSPPSETISFQGLLSCVALIGLWQTAFLRHPPTEQAYKTARQQIIVSVSAVALTLPLHLGVTVCAVVHASTTAIVWIYIWKPHYKESQPFYSWVIQRSPENHARFMSLTLAIGQSALFTWTSLHEVSPRIDDRMVPVPVTLAVLWVVQKLFPYGWYTLQQATVVIDDFPANTLFSVVQCTLGSASLIGVGTTIVPWVFTTGDLTACICMSMCIFVVGWSMHLGQHNSRGLHPERIFRFLAIGSMQCALTTTMAPFLVEQAFGRELLYTSGPSVWTNGMHALGFYAMGIPIWMAFDIPYTQGLSTTVLGLTFWMAGVIHQCYSLLSLALLVLCSFVTIRVQAGVQGSIDALRHIHITTTTTTE